MTVSASSTTRKRTTILGFAVCLIALIGVFFAGLQFIAVSVLDWTLLPPPQPSKFQLYAAAVAGLLPKLALLMAGIFLLRRERWALPFIGLALVLSFGDILWQWQVTIPMQLRTFVTGAQRFGYFAGLYVFYFGTVVFYVSLFLYLRSKGARAEFAKPNPIPPPLHESPIAS